MLGSSELQQLLLHLLLLPQGLLLGLLHISAMGGRDILGLIPLMKTPIKEES